MGNTEPQTPHLDTAATPGPRVTAARTRNRRKRALVIAAASAATLAVAGTATAAVIATGTPPETTVNAAQIPQAEPDPLTTPEDTPAEPDPATAEQAGEAVSNATQNSTADGSAVPAEPEPQDDPDTTQQSAPSTEGTPTGEGGTCQASFYGDGFHGATTANGETFDTYGMTAAHKTLPFDTMVKVTNPDNGTSVTVRINDRGPYIDGRCLDLSTAAFDQIIGTGAGVGTVQWQVVG
ncbi:septal ring lytic transglycosylase RlpA family protein [Nocardiopsis sp. YSL2]|uniref:septal ring lytic transglycosylase RlpA family protein n=1 Tax=Nocardiopsis sp. YSL2 TaxID=2939492 RepID=UPI0026F42D9F|nr:septal ring lytic transglycosylase RlpA family protein [Nocardiopsis sp. YSL2]